MSGRHPQPPKRAGASKGQARPAPPRGTNSSAAATKAKAAEPAAPKKAPAEKPARTHPPGAVSALGLSKVYGDRPALAALDLHVPYGESLALVGHNGSGKTTFLRLAAGLLDPSDGSVLIDGHPAGSLPARAALAYLSDSPTFYEDLSVWEHLEYVARLHGHEDWEQTAAEARGQVIGTVVEPEVVEEVGRVLLPVLVAVQPGDVLEVLPDRQVLVERRRVREVRQRGAGG